MRLIKTEVCVLFIADIVVALGRRDAVGVEDGGVGVEGRGHELAGDLQREQGHLLEGLGEELGGLWALGLLVGDGDVRRVGHDGAVSAVQGGRIGAEGGVGRGRCGGGGDGCGGGGGSMKRGRRPNVSIIIIMIVVVVVIIIIIVQVWIGGLAGWDGYDRVRP